MAIEFTQHAAFRSDTKTRPTIMPAVIEINGIQYISRMPWDARDAMKLNEKTEDFIQLKKGENAK